MPRGNAEQTKFVYSGKNDDFIVMAESVEAVDKWKQDSSVPLVDVVDGYAVFCSHKQGAQGIMDTASNAALENEFGTHKLDDVIPKILKSGEPQIKTNPERQGDRNVSHGSMGGH